MSKLLITKVCSCPTCGARGQPQPLEAFGNNKSSPDGKHWYCRNCNNAKQRAWKAANARKVLAWKKDYDIRKKRELRAAQRAAVSPQLEMDL